MAKVYGEFYGCSANKSDYEIMLGLLKSSGFKIVNSPEKSDINLLVTCAVKTPTVSRMFYRAKSLTAARKPLVVAGCISKVDKERGIIEKINPEASFVGPDSITKIVDVVDATLHGKKVLELERIEDEKVGLPRSRTNELVDIVEISSGCLSNCSFCATKLARGSLYSYRPHSIREQVKQGLKEGVKEFWLTSQDSSAYGRDIDTNLAELVESVTRIDGQFLVRIGMMNPLHFKKVEVEELIGSYKNEKVFKFLHLCVQSGSNKVLKDMRRGYKVEDFIDYVKKFRKEIPKLMLETDIILGFPTENEDDFEQTVKLVKEIRPDAVNVSKYGARPGTIAARMKQLSPKIVSERSKLLYDFTKKIAQDNNKKWLGWKGGVLIDEKGTKESTWMGRNYCYKPIVVESSESLFGKFVNIQIADVKSNYLVGKVI